MGLGRFTVVIGEALLERYEALLPEFTWVGRAQPHSESRSHDRFHSSHGRGR